MDNRLERNKRNAMDFYDMMFNRCEPAKAVALFVGDEYIQHNPEVGDGKQPFIDYFERMAREHEEMVGADNPQHGDVHHRHRHDDHERLHLGAGGGPGHHRRRRPGGHLHLRPGDGVLHAHRWQAGRHIRRQADLHRRCGLLRHRHRHRFFQPEPGNADHRLVRHRRPGVGADDAQHPDAAAENL
ncbi:hypothetical protein BMS3Abin01_00280 [bacterium BMS3Abin01]|nr:hypothetical protein BMS3Abin01_00280 [bacterium BMS3Abin01]